VTALAHDFDPARRGYHAVYRKGELNRCPGCWRSHWLVGRNTSECAFCGTALPLETSLGQSARITSSGEAGCPWPKPSLERPRIVRRK
jgi:hypothetical protein